jgi:hypothetical protein
MFFEKISDFSASFCMQYSVQLFTGYDANDQPVFSARIQKMPGHSVAVKTIG